MLGLLSANAASAAPPLSDASPPTAAQPGNEANSPAAADPPLAEPAATPAEISPPMVPAQQLDPVTVNALPLSASQERRQSTAATMVFGREELDRQRDSSVADVLKRLPGVTISGRPGRGGEIRMRGLGNGYTQILLNGEPSPRGFSLDSLTPDQVERIEIMRAPVAEHSARAIAGTINIVLRGDVIRTGNEFRPTLGWEAGRTQPGLGLQHDGKAGPLAYTVGINASHRDTQEQGITSTVAQSLPGGETLLDREERDISHSRSDRLQVNGRLNWKLDDGDSLSFQPFVSAARGSSDGTIALEQGAGLAAPPFALSRSHAENSSTYARGIGNLKLRLADGGRVEGRLNLGLADSATQSLRSDLDSAGVPLHQLLGDASVHDRSVSTAASYGRPIGSGHLAKVGLEVETGRRSEGNASLEDGRNPLAAFGDSVHANTLRLAAFAQDECEVNALWSLYGGLRWEQIRTRSTTAVAAIDNVSQVASPTLQSLWRFSEHGKDQVRLALARSYRAPSLGNLVALPSLAANYPVAGSNTAASPDTVGTPGLRPELAWGLDAAFEHYFSSGGLVSISAFQRSIDDLIHSVTTLETVAWSTQQRWISRPFNVGHAVARGVELEGKLRLDEVLAGAPKLDLRINYSHFWSSVEQVPGPDNRLDQQPRQTANLGLDYAVPGWPLTLGGSLNWTPEFIVQQSATQTYSQGRKRELDLYGLWRIDPNTRLRLAIANLSHDDYATGDIQRNSDTAQAARTVSRTWPSLSMRLEARF
jgi:iron complex outermembrane receptor protein